MKIEKLTPEQEAELPFFRDEWLKVGLSTTRVDKERATAAVKALYAAAGEEEPVVMHFDSPMQCIMAINFFRHFKVGADEQANLRDNLWDNLGANLWDNLGANLWDNLGDNLRANLRDNLWDNLGANLGANLRANLRDNLWDNLGANLWDNLGANLWDNLGANLWDNLGANLWDNLRDTKVDFVDTYFWAGQDAPWLAFYQFGQKIGVTYGRKAHFDAYIEFAKSCGWMYAYKGLAFVSDRPTVISKDAETRLHSETGPSIAFSDGYEMHSWRGVTIPGEWIKNKSNLSASDVLRFENVEQRAAGMEIIGWAKALDHLPHKIIDSHPDPQCGDLIEVSIPGLPEPELYLKFECPRNGQMMEAVNKRELAKHDLQHAHAWHAGVPARLFSYAQQRS